MTSSFLGGFIAKISSGGGFYFEVQKWHFDLKNGFKRIFGWKERKEMRGRDEEGFEKKQKEWREKKKKKASPSILITLLHLGFFQSLHIVTLVGILLGIFSMEEEMGFGGEVHLGAFELLAERDEEEVDLSS